MSGVIENSNGKTLLTVADEGVEPRLRWGAADYAAEIEQRELLDPCRTSKLHISRELAWIAIADLVAERARSDGAE